jgi:hypothetical protein
VAAFDPGSNPTLSSGFDDVTFAAWVSDNILDEERPYEAMKPFFRYEGPKASIAVDFPKMADPGAGTSNYTEGTGLANTALTTDKATATAVANGIVATVTDEVDETAVLSLIPYVSGVLGRSVGEEFETTATALLDDFANTSGSSGQTTSYADLLDATNKLAQRDQTGTPVGVIDPSQAGNVRIDLGTSGAAAISRPDVAGAEAFRESLGSGPVFNLAGAPWFQTSLVTSTGGGCFIRGVALGLYEIRPPRLEPMRYNTLPGTTLAATSRYGVVEIRDRAGQTLIGS